jgi:hypothetical protein
MPLVIVARILNEEQVLSRELADTQIRPRVNSG